MTCTKINSGNRTRRWLLHSAFIVLILLSWACDTGKQQEAEGVSRGINFSTDSIFNLAHDKYLRSCGRLDTAGGFPRNAHRDGSWRQVPADDWTSGFFPGTLWYIFEYMQTTDIKEEAIKWTKALEDIQYMDHHHDIGFMMYCSYGNGYRLTLDSSYHPVLIQSARTLTTRFNPITGTIRSWDWEPENHPTIMENMMNLELLMWAFRETQDSLFCTIAVSHSDTTMKYHFRPDGSSYHLVNYDPYRGGVQYKQTKQGVFDESMWARGQAWGMYGYTFMYQFTGKEKYLEMAKKTTQRFLERLPDDVVPYWDFDAPGIPNEPKDASSAALASSALLSLFEITEEARYYEQAVNLLNALSGGRFLDKDPGFGGLILHSTGSKPGNSEVDVHLNYADYYYLEALLKLERILQELDDKVNTAE